MNRRIFAIVFVLALGLVAGALLRSAGQQEAVAAPDTPAGFASPINGGCYIAAADVCKIHIDPFVININDGAGAKLERFTLYANGSPIYDFRTDVSNPPGVDYSPFAGDAGLRGRMRQGVCGQHGSEGFDRRQPA